MNKQVEGIHFYFNAEGLMVFTEQHHLERGFCCGMKCKHCSYQHKNVAEQKEKLLNQPRENK